MAESSVRKLFNKLSIHKALVQARSISIDGSSADLEFLVFL